MGRKIKLLIGCFGMFVLILDSRLAISAAANGIELCLRAVVPSLFPFFFFSGLLVDSLSSVTLPFAKSIAKALRIDPRAVPIWLMGLLGGYPVGAQAIGQAVSKGSISPSDGRRMLAFCNNCGPAFIFGFLSNVFDSKWMVLALWLIHILSGILCALIIPGRSGAARCIESSNISLRSRLAKCIVAMSLVCGWIILFRIGLTFIDTWFGFLLPNEIMVALSGFLELSNGCLSLDAIVNTPTRFVLCSGMLGFGGICVTMQTVSVCPDGMHTDMYLPGKMIQSGFSYLLASLVMLCVFRSLPAILPTIGIIILIIPAIFLHFQKKRSGFLQAMGI